MISRSSRACSISAGPSARTIDDETVKAARSPARHSTSARSSPSTTQRRSSKSRAAVFMRANQCYSDRTNIDNGIRNITVASTSNRPDCVKDLWQSWVPAAQRLTRAFHHRGAAALPAAARKAEILGRAGKTDGAPTCGWAAWFQFSTQLDLGAAARFGFVEGPLRRALAAIRIGCAWLAACGHADLAAVQRAILGEQPFTNSGAAGHAEQTGQNRAMPSARLRFDVRVHRLRLEPSIGPRG